MRIAFTDKALSALKPKPARYEMQDTYCPGLSVRVTPEGRKTFNVKYRYPFRQFVPLLLATAQRRGELANMRWSEIDFTDRTWIIPTERSKNGKAHYVPLSAYALELLAEVPRFIDCDYVFTTTRRSPVSGFSKALRRLWQATGADDWRYHDLRRTAASGMAQARVEPLVIEKILNHIIGKISGIALVYNRYEYLDEAQEALEDWGANLARLSDEANVVL